MAGGIGMAQAGDTYQVKLKETHLNWGTYRNPTNREPVEGEAYIKIPRRYAVQYSIYNSPEGLGSNLFIVSSRDGIMKDFGHRGTVVLVITMRNSLLSIRICGELGSGIETKEHRLVILFKSLGKVRQKF